MGTHPRVCDEAGLMDPDDLLRARAYQVSECWTCPCCVTDDANDEIGDCSLVSHDGVIIKGEASPDWCPLREGAIILQHCEAVRN